MLTIHAPESAVKRAAHLFVSLLRDGYTPGVPPHVHPEALRIDAEACDEMLCGYCLGMGLAYRPFHKDASYRVVALCKTCGFAEEV